MKVVFIYPGIARIGFRSYGRGTEGSWIHHGLCSLSACVKKAGHEVALIDLRRLSGWGEFADRIKQEGPAVVGITMMSTDFDPAMKCVKIVKSIDPRIKVVVGGVHPTLMLDEVQGDSGIDHIVLGEGEISLAELLTAIGSGAPAERIIIGKKPDLDSLPFPDRGLFGGLEQPVPAPEFRSPFVTLIAGRGCLYNCSFCQPAEKTVFGDKVRRRSAGNVIAELQQLRQQYQFHSMMLHDDCLTEDKQWVTEFCQQYRQQGFTAPFVCQSRADIVCRNEDMVQLMAAAGLKLMIIGFESGNQRVLNFLRKGTTVEQNLRAAEICRKYGIKVWANYMFGIPTETKDEVMDTVTMIRTIKPDIYSPAFYTPLPGSDLFTYCQEHDISLIGSHRDYFRNPKKAKIKGVDYAFLGTAVRLSMNRGALKHFLLTSADSLVSAARDLFFSGR